MSFSNTESYNGYTNKETWLVAIHFDNVDIDQLEIKTQHEFSDSIGSYQVLKDFVKKSYEKLTATSDNKIMLNDLITASLGRVNYGELLENLLEEGCM